MPNVGTLPSVFSPALGKDLALPSVGTTLPSVLGTVLGKELLYRAPDGLHSAKLLALAKEPVSGSVKIKFYVQTQVIQWFNG